MTVQPVLPLVLLILLAVIAGLLVWWPAGQRERSESALTRSRRSTMVALLLVAALRPGVPGGEIRLTATDLDVYFLIDTTSSVMAQDYAGGQPRLAGVRADVKGIAAQLPGARYTVMSFDHETVTRLPLTSDANALGSSVDTLLAETSTWSQGSSVTEARTALADALDRGRTSHPERARLVFYLGDGEQTADTAPDPFDIDPTLLNGGAVLGYGTSQGGRMKQTGTRREDYILDPATGQPALSKIDEKELQAIAGQLKMAYLHRTSDDGAASIVAQVALKDSASLTSTDTTRAAGGRTEFYWVFLLVLAALAAWDLGVSVAAATALRAGRRHPLVPPATPVVGTPAGNEPSVTEKVSTSTPGGAE